MVDFGYSMSELAEIYGPIKDELERVESLIKEELTSSNPYVNEFLAYTMNFHGKRVRPALLLYSAKICGGISDEHIVLSAVVELLHNATLVHDDILDEAELRRQVKTMNAKWGNETAVIVGDYLFAKAFLLCASLNSKDVFSTITSTTQKICLGELFQILSKFNLDIKEEEYIEAIKLKTATLFGAACALGTTGSRMSSRVINSLEKFGLNLGIAFQIADDCLDIMGDEKEMGKSLGTDVGKGKLTLPVIKLLRELSDADKSKVTELLSNRDGLPNKRQTIFKMIQKYDTMTYSFKVAGEFIEKAKSELENVGDSTLVQSLRNLADFVGNRKN